ncbi:hypothetical protein MJP36_06445 [Pseudomonas palleroniana]|uniref:hypothetical protein n=1 Tax=Pseudomonas palleroniana TaxID=191390 RepID=UPI001FCC77E6|nr:hypothetical protein [Pseudomonas palleroniana]UOK39496.1 hypothetical protein MJP36_06445 [Pseudomonas palleroniana]
MSARIDKSHPVEYKTKRGITVQIGFSWSPPLDVPVGATLTLVGPRPLTVYVEGDHWDSYEQAFQEAHEAAEHWVNLLAG